MKFRQNSVLNLFRNLIKLLSWKYRTHLGLVEPTNPGGGTERLNLATSCCCTSLRLSVVASSLMARSLLRWRSQVQEGSPKNIFCSSGGWVTSWNVGGLLLDNSLSSEPDPGERRGNVENIFRQVTCVVFCKGNNSV